VKVAGLRTGVSRLGEVVGPEQVAHFAVRPSVEVTGARNTIND
jgi:hypothetical protein